MPGDSYIAYDQGHVSNVTASSKLNADRIVGRLNCLSMTIP